VGAESSRSVMTTAHPADAGSYSLTELFLLYGVHVVVSSGNLLCLSHKQLAKSEKSLKAQFRGAIYYRYAMPVPVRNKPFCMPDQVL